MSRLYRTTVTGKDWMIVVGLLALLAIVALAFVFVVQGKMAQSLVDIKTKDDQVQGEIDRAQKLKDNIQDLRDEMALAKDLVDAFEKRLPLKSDLSNMTSKIEELATDVGLRVNIDPGQTAEDAHKITIPYSVKAFGDFHQITIFINRLERHERYLKVSDLKIGEEKEGVSTAEFTLSTYRFVQSAVPPPPPAPAVAGGAS